MSAKRDISKPLQYLRAFLLKRENVNFLRFRDEIAARTQPPPNLPEGPNAKLAGNYYYSRDGRRLVKPDEVIFEGGSIPKLSANSETPTEAIQRVPGRVHLWDK